MSSYHHSASRTSATTFRGFSLGTVLFLIFLVLKLTGAIDWSWWWVTAPLWGPWALFTVGILIVLAVKAAGGRRHDRKLFR